MLSYPDNGCRSDAGPTSERCRSDVGLMSERRRSDVGATSERRRSDVGPTSERRRADVRPTSERRRPDVGATSARSWADVGIALLGHHTTERGRSRRNANGLIRARRNANVFIPMFSRARRNENTGRNEYRLTVQKITHMVKLTGQNFSR